MKAISFPVNYKWLVDTNIKIGDFNFDGFCDLMGIFSIDSYRSVSILENKGDLQFQVMEANLDPLHQISNPHQAALYDFTESGKLSIIVIGKATRDNNTTGYPRYSIINNLI